MNKGVTLFIVGAGLIGIISMATIRISNKGLRKIKSFEGLRLKPYKDIAGKDTIGWGHLIKLPTEAYLLRKEGITPDKAEKLLKEDIKTAESAVNTLVKAPLTGNQYDALVSFVYNVGEGAFATSTMLKYLNAEEYQKAANEFPRWRYAGGEESAGLLKRRAVEQQTFMT